MNNPQSISVEDLANATSEANVQWVGRRLNEVLPPHDIVKLVLTRAITSAPSPVDVNNVRSMLARTTVLEASRFKGFFQPYTWEGVILFKNGTSIAFGIDNEAICIVGQHGYACAKRDNRAPDVEGE